MTSCGATGARRGTTIDKQQKQYRPHPSREPEQLIARRKHGAPRPTAAAAAPGASAQSCGCAVKRREAKARITNPAERNEALPVICASVPPPPNTASTNRSPNTRPDAIAPRTIGRSLTSREPLQSPLELPLY